MLNGGRKKAEHTVARQLREGRRKSKMELTSFFGDSRFVNLWLTIIQQDPLFAVYSIDESFIRSEL